MSGGEGGFSRRPEMGIARTPVRRRSPEEQATYRARTEGGVGRSEQKAERVDAKAELRASNPFEVLREALAERGDIFDAKGKVTPGGRKLLIDSGWNPAQIKEVEDRQMSHVGEVLVIPAGESQDEGPIISAYERLLILKKAKERADKMLEIRGKIEAELRRAEGESNFAGIQAYTAAIRAGKGEARARQDQQDAIDANNLQRQREKNLQVRQAGRG